ncbi:autotransporter outer membrane beta-barrel domain-containing protein [Stenotrophomonas sp. YAU14A_MKIMI4_1]|nr:autotransporter outer membrane beta-barrel domain-containing protein [Stenotrophomonas sp. YAU14A_MKIMI4_1]
MALDDMNIRSGARGLFVSGAGSTATISSSTIAAEGRALFVNNGAYLSLDGVTATSNGERGDAALMINESTASVTNSAITGALTAVDLVDGSLDVSGTTLKGATALSVRGTSQAATATLSNSQLEGAIAVRLQGDAEVTASGSRLTSTGQSLNDAAVSMSGGKFSAANGTVIEADRTGVNMSTDATFTLDASSLSVRNGDAFLVGTGIGSGDTASISISNGSTVDANGGNVLNVRTGVQADMTVEGSRLLGDIVVAEGGTGNVTLGSNSSLTGAITNGGAISLDQSLWRLTAASSVDTLALGSGSVVELGDGATFNTLTVAGNFTGNDGTIVFNTVLAGDDAATDKLVIGGDTSGTANVRVNNVGGAGAQTGQGIELISVGGASNGQFNLAGRAVGGQYEYFLFKGTGADGNWYLRSQLPTQPDPCDTDPTLPECNPVLPGPDPDPVLRPEPGAYLANLQAAQSMFRVGYHDRHAGQNAGRAWARVDGSRTGFDAISRQLDIRGNSQALTVGADLWRADNGSSVGVMLSTGNASSTSTNELTGYYARGKVKGEALGVYGTWRGGSGGDPYAGFYVDGSVQRAQFRNRVEGIGLADERYDSRAWQGAVEGGYAIRVGGASNGGIYLEPQLQVGYSRWDDYRHTETNGTVVGAENADGMFGRAGVRLSGVTRWGNGAVDVQPYVAANWLHTRSKSQIRMDDEVVDARIPRNRGEFSAGASLKFANGVGAWGGLSLQKASGFHQTSAQVGVSYSW